MKELLITKITKESLEILHKKQELCDKLGISMPIPSQQTQHLSHESVNDKITRLAPYVALWGCFF